VPAQRATALERLIEFRAVTRARFPFGVLYAVFAALIVLLPDPRHYRDFYYIAIAVPFLLLVRWDELRPVWRSWTFRLCVAYLVWMWLTVFWSPHGGAEEAYDVGRRVLSAMLFIAVTAWLVQRNQTFAPRLFHALAWACLVTIGLSAIWLRWRYGIAGTRLRAWVWENPNTAGEIYAVIVVGLLAWSLRAAASLRLRALIVALAVPITAALILTGSRASLVAMAIALGIPALMAGSRRLAVGAVAGVAVLLVTLLAWFGVDDIYRRADSHRFELWGRYWDMAFERPWLGHGATFDPTILLSNDRTIGDPHNMLLSGLLLGGVIGLFVVLGLFIAAGRAAVRSWRARGETGPLALFLYLAVHGLVESTPMIDNAGWKWLYFWLPLGLIAGSEALGLRPQGHAAIEPSPAPADHRRTAAHGS
jgi:O-antigen ligase